MECPLHFACFDVTTGEALSGPDLGRRSIPGLETLGPETMQALQEVGEIINDVENSVIGWKSLPGSDVVTAGSVNFSTVRAGRSTQVSVHLQYSPPASRAGALLAGIFGRNPASMIREDLRRLKQLLEAGEIARAQAGA